MNERSEIGAVLQLWLEQDGPNTMPDRVVDIVADRIARQPQRRAWRLLRRSQPMNRMFTYAAAVAAVVLVAVVAWRFLPGDSGFGTVNPTPSPSVAPSPMTPWDSPGTRCGFAGCGGPLTAGTYSSRSLIPAVTYTLSSNWVNVDDWPDFFMLYPDTPANRAVMVAEGYPPYLLILPKLMVSPSRACADEDGAPTDEVAMDAAGVVEYMTAIEALTTTGPEAITIDGLVGQQLDFGLGADWTGCLPGTPIGETDTGSERYRFIVLDTPDGDTLMIRLRAPTDLEALLADAMPIVESFDFAGLR